MKVKSDKVRQNEKLLKQLPEVIDNGTLNIDDETLDIKIIKKEIKNKYGDKTFYTIDHEEFPSDYNVIRLYLPLLGEAGYVPSVEEIKTLMSGQKIHPPEKAFQTKYGRNYTVKSIFFEPKKEVVFRGKKLNFYGEIEPEFES